MRVILHGIKSLLRRPAKTVMLFLILFVVFNLIFTGFIIENSIMQSKEFIRMQIGSAVEYRINNDSLMSYVGSGIQGDRNRTMSLPSLSLQVAEKISMHSFVNNYYVSESADANSSNMSPAQTQQTSGGFRMSFSDFTLIGTNNPEPLDFALGNVSLSNGSLLSAENISRADKVIMISDAVASNNDLRVGDIVKLSYASSFQIPGSRSATPNIKEYDFEIIGIYKTNDNDFNINSIFISNDVIYEITGRSSSDNTNATVVFLIDHPDHVLKFIEESTPHLTSEFHILYSNDREYDNLTRPLNLLSVITSILIYVVFIAGAAIILAIVTIFIRDRKFEIGLLLASGESRIKITSQFIFEVSVIAVVTFFISVGSANIISGYVGSWIVENQLLAEDSIVNPQAGENVQTGIIGNMGMRIGGTYTTNIYGEVNMQNVANEFDTAVNSNVVIQLLLVSIILVFIGSTVPLVVIMRYKPKRILQDY